LNIKKSSLLFTIIFFVFFLKNTFADFVPEPPRLIGACIGFNNAPINLTISGKSSLRVLINTAFPRMGGNPLHSITIDTEANDEIESQSARKDIIYSFISRERPDILPMDLPTSITEISANGHIFRWCEKGQTVIRLSIPDELIFEKNHCLANSKLCWVNCNDENCSISPREYPR